jgi:hypothetical protein
MRSGPHAERVSDRDFAGRSPSPESQPRQALVGRGAAGRSAESLCARRRRPRGAFAVGPVALETLSPSHERAPARTRLDAQRGSGPGDVAVESKCPRRSLLLCIGLSSGGNGPRSPLCSGVHIPSSGRDRVAADDRQDVVAEARDLRRAQARDPREVRARGGPVLVATGSAGAGGSAPEPPRRARPVSASTHTSHRRHGAAALRRESVNTTTIR